MICRDCHKEENSLVRGRCTSCREKYDYEKSHRSYLNRKEKGTIKRFGRGICSVCGKEMILYKPQQMTHRACSHNLSIVENNYNQYPRDSNGQMIAREMVLEKIGSIPPNFVVHHLDCDPTNNVFENFLILSKKDHARLHAYLRRERSSWLKNQEQKSENCWKLLIDQKTTAWLETTNANVIKISDIGQSAAEPLQEISFEEGSETMHALPTALAMVKI